MIKLSDLRDDQVEELRSALEIHRNEALDYMNAYITGDARVAWDYYYGVLPRPVNAGSSKYVDRTVWESVNGTLQDLLNVFTSGDGVVYFTAQDGETEEKAEAATALVNQTVLRDNDGYRVLADCLKECLVTRNGFIKRYWDATIKSMSEDIEDVNPIALAAYIKGLEDAGFEGVDAKIIVRPGEETVDCEITYTVKVEQVKIEYVPMEQVIVNQKAKTIQDAVYFAQRRMMSKAELIDMGYPADQIDMVTDWIIGDDTNMDVVTWSRTNYRVDLNNTDGYFDNDPAQRCWVYEQYIRTGLIDPLGRVKLYQVFQAENVIMEITEVDEIPFDTFCPYPIPGTLFGESIWDITKDIQDLRTMLYRAVIDNANQANFGQYLAVKGQYDRRSLLDNVPGSIVEVQNLQSVELMPYNQLPSATMDLINMTDDMKEMRTGVTKLGMGIDPEVFKNDNAYATVGLMMNQAQNRIRMVCRNLANNGMKSLFISIYDLIRQNTKHPIEVMTPNGYVLIDPKDMIPRNRVLTSVAISSSEKSDRANTLSTVHNLLVSDQALAPLYGMPQQRFMMSQIMTLVGISDVDNYLLPMKDYKPAPPPIEAIQQIELNKANLSKTEAETKQIYADIIQAQEQLVFTQEKAADDMQMSNLQFQHTQETDADKFVQDRQQFELNFTSEQYKHQIELMKVELQKAEMLLDAKLEQEKIDASKSQTKAASKTSD